MPWSSNATFLVEACLDGRTARGIYKPHAGERPALGLPRRPLPPRGRGLRAQRRARLGRRAPHDRPRRPPARDRLAPALRRGRLRAALLHAARRRGHPPAAPADGRVRHRLQQHRPQGRALPRSTATATSGASTTACRSTPSSSCAPSSGTSAASPSTTTCWPTSSGWSTTACPTGVAAPARHLRARRRAHPGPRPAARARAPDRRDRPPLPLAPRLSRRARASVRRSPRSPWRRCAPDAAHGCSDGSRRVPPARSLAHRPTTHHRASSSMRSSARAIAPVPAAERRRFSSSSTAITPAAPTNTRPPATRPESPSSACCCTARVSLTRLLERLAALACRGSASTVPTKARPTTIHPIRRRAAGQNAMAHDADGRERHEHHGGVHHQRMSGQTEHRVESGEERDR